MPRWSSRSGRHSPMRSLSFANAASERIRPRMRPCREHNRAAPRQLGQGNDAPPTQFLWRSHAQLGAPHRRAIPDSLRRENEGLREGTHGRRQDLAGDPALPEALRRSRALSTSRERALNELTTYRNVGSAPLSTRFRACRDSVQRRRDTLYISVPGDGSSVRRDNGTVTPSLVLTRKPPLNLPEVRRGTFDVLVDGRLVGSYELHNTFEAEVEPGNHTVKVRDGRFSSREFSFQVSDGQTVSFNCHGRRISPIFLASFIVPRWGLNLTRT